MKKIRIALVVGHTEGKDKGAYSETLKTSEFDYWLDIAKRIENLGNIEVHIFDTFTHKIQSYYEREKALADKINNSGVVYDVVFELHFNAASPLAHGTECLHWFASEKGRKIANRVSNYICDNLNMTIRGNNGARALVNKNDRGYWFTYLLRYPAVILEPFFGSNKEDCEKFRDRDKVAKVLNEVFQNLNVA